MVFAMGIDDVSLFPRATLPSVLAFMSMVQQQGINPFTTRFRLEAHNACKSSKEGAWDRAIHRHAAAVLSIDLAEELACS